MLLRHSALYLLARGVPGIVNFLAVPIYTRVLSPDEYGRYALVIAGVGLVQRNIFSVAQALVAAVSSGAPAQSQGTAFCRPGRLCRNSFSDYTIGHIDCCPLARWHFARIVADGDPAVVGPILV